MKLSVTSFFLLLFLWNPIAGFSQNSIPISSNLKEENFLKFQNHFFKALAQKAIYNYRVAIENLEKCNELKPNDVSVLFELSKNYLMMKRFLEAEQYAVQALKIASDNYWVLEHLGRIYLASSNINSAIVIQKKIIEINPKEKEKLVFLYFQNNQLEQANTLLVALEKENQLTPNLVQFKKRFFKKMIQKTAIKSENLQDLIAKFESDKSFETLRKIVTLPTITNKQLLFYSNKGLELFPAQAFVYLMNAKALNKNNNFEKAIEQLTNGIDFVIDDNNLEASFYEELAISYGKLGKEKEAIKNKNKALALRKKQE
ncbi:Beta-barrel assembly-enhancing protease [Polaribacter huanghezhanensis]|uniref:tetratricopeptide repeat protein n=1 Tax=Polaribacter huanghezhanensis TaxID=1354726 RepID=UPI002649ED3A|nr:hypothetical protein [Polaribacter huanghezhanensis]WKD85568.1 Beta-barrel assembly-enhancing protease [Polaribacter huanghezhanensis]